MRRPAVLLLAAAGLAACGPSEPPGPDAAGRAYFRQARCVSCHRIGAEGAATGPDLTAVGFRHTPEWLDAFLKDPQAWNPRTLMPNPRFSAEARKAVVDYLAGRKGQDWPKGGRPWDAPSLVKDPVARGRVIYARAGCAACHGFDRRGGYPNANVAGGRIPSLDKVKDGYTKAELIDKIRRGARPDPEDPAKPPPPVSMPAWGGLLDDAELDAVATYLLDSSASTAGEDGW